MTVRARFAPSPTGRVHIGNMRVAIFNWLFARHEGGKFLIRIEDTDRERSTPEAVKAVFDAMEWLGLNHDEEPMYQSARFDAHLAAAEILLNKGLAYKQDKGGSGKGECIIFRMPNEDAAFHDEIKGDLKKAAGDLSDFVIVRSDRTPVFHLANVVDDIEMRITHVIRGDDHVENTYRHVALYRALDADVPRYAHLPMIVNREGKPYSKRDGAAFIGEFRDMGVHPDALLNYLSLLGWSPGNDREKMTREEAVRFFSLDRVKSSAAQMDMKKLTHLNAEYIAESPHDEFIRSARKVIAGRDWAGSIDDGYFEKVCALMQSRTHLYSYASDWKYFFAENPEYDEKAVAKNLRKPGSKAALAMLRKSLADVDFEEHVIEGAIHAVERACGIPEGKLNLPIRIAITGISTGAGIYETMALLGKARVLARLDHAVERLCA